MFRDHELGIAVHPPPHRFGWRAIGKKVVSFSVERVKLGSIHGPNQRLLRREMAIESADPNSGRASDCFKRDLGLCR